ncbi:TPA: AVAST type 1 anti-phage system protease Avs1b [Citrobacter koseri]|uniref:AVAST type 1 anti-phage system protease Avs1b n=1 Tax=uncultured Citrobacter sp. TaxID=200446 RepID=UPI002595EB0A|nr:AVAST type 1 anti-phage system protease Avs1b [uncultured Citrobacter sp.]
MDNAVKYAATENEIRFATVQIECEGSTGSGTLIAANKVLTAAHCVVSDKPGAPVTVTFTGTEPVISIRATISDTDYSCDVCLLTLSEPVNIAPVALSIVQEREGSLWKSFGYPASRLGAPHYLYGAISQYFPGIIHGIDMDLSVNADCRLEQYEGVSGAAVLSGNKMIAMVRIRMDGGLGAVSLDTLSGILLRNGLIPENIVEGSALIKSRETMLDRTEFLDNFETFILGSTGRAVLLEGSPGVGKTTFCRHYQPLNEKLASVGVYEFTPEDGAGAAFKVLPEVFADWLADRVAIIISGRPARREETEKVNLTHKVSELLATLSDYWKQRGKYGVIFIDAINEASGLGQAMVAPFTALLPVTLPEHIKLVFTAPSLSAAGTAFRHWLTPQDCISLTLLSHQEVLQLSALALKDMSPSMSLLLRVCDRAQGHPLYLRYILEYLKANPDETSLNTFPVFSGSIETYYERLWQELIKDDSAVNLLGLLSRLRWGVEMVSLLPALSETEQTAFLPTLDRIRHLLPDPASSALCHQSFAEFINIKTGAIDTLLHGRLADYCLNSVQPYGLINRIYHLLLSSQDRHSEAAMTCTQDWADACVNNGARPDLLIHDIRHTLINALHRADAVESIRLLLLLQRITFRHHFLFLQSAFYSGLALAALGKPDEALEQFMPSGHLVLDLADAIDSAHILTDHGYHQHALKLLEKVKSLVDLTFENHDLNLSQFTHLNLAWVRAELIAGVIDGKGRTRSVVEYLYQAVQTISENIDKAAQHNPVYERAFVPLQAEMEAVNIAFNDRSVSLKSVKDRFGEVPKNILDLMLSALMRAHDMIIRYRLPMPQQAPLSVWEDLKELLHADVSFTDRIRFNAITSLIFFNAPSGLVIKIAEVFSLDTLPEIVLIEKNEAQTDSTSIVEQGQFLLTVAYLNPALPCPDITPAQQDCHSWLKSLTEAVFWCSGQAQRAVVDNDHERTQQLLAFVQTTLLPALSSSLEDRTGWHDAWALPEHTLPVIYEELISMFGACWPESVNLLTDFIINRAPEQCGIYSEGFRRVMKTIIHALLNENRFPDQADTAFELLEILHAFVSAYTENRQELVPELLEIIPAYVRLDAPQLAHQTYTEMLSVSMGPAWYKEDQFTLLTNILQVLPHSTETDTTLSQVAGYLEKASGEMTFRRYVRHDKSRFIGELIRRGRYAQCFAYYRQQSYGTHSEMLHQLSQPAADSPLPLKSMRFPGGALDETYAVELIVSKLRNRVDWHLRWALLEIFSFGCTGNLAEPFAEMINEFTPDDKDLSEAVRRLFIVFNGDVSFSEQHDFIRSFLGQLSEEHKPLFTALIEILSEDANSESFHSPATDDENGQSASAELREDVALQPGLFGKQAAIRAADARIKEANKAAARKNTLRASQIAVESLRLIQEGDWSVWGRNHHLSDVTNAHILASASSAGEVLRAYAPLVEHERYAPSWKIASHLLEAAASHFSPQEARAVAQRVLEHNRYLLGSNGNAAGQFAFLDEPDISDAAEETLNFLMWMLEHPLKFRRERALEAMQWLASGDDLILRQCVAEALTSDSAVRVEALMALTDRMSAKYPTRVWDCIASQRSLFEWLADTSTLSQICLFERIASRAGVDVKNEIAAYSRTRSRSLVSRTREQPSPLSTWARPVAHVLAVMEEQKIDVRGLIGLLEERILQQSGMTDINVAFELEQLLARGFSVRNTPSPHRWEAMVRFSLNQILHEAASCPDLKGVEPLLRVWNPASQERVLSHEICNQTARIIRSIMEQNFKQVSGTDEGFFLHYLDEIELPGGGPAHLVEISAVLTTAYDGHEHRRAGEESRFNATLVPDADRVLDAHLTCQRVSLQPLLLGGATPAVVSKKFMQMTHTVPSDFIRRQWRSGRSLSKSRWGEPISRGSLLIMKRDVTLPPGLGLAWSVTIDGELQSMFSYAQRRPS